MTKKKTEEITKNEMMNNPLFIQFQRGYINFNGEKKAQNNITVGPIF